MQLSWLLQGGKWAITVRHMCNDYTSSLRESVQKRGYFWSAFSRICTSYGEILRYSHAVHKLICCSELILSSIWAPRNFVKFQITCLIIRLIVIDIALLTAFCNCCFVISRCFVIACSLICNCPRLKYVSFNTKCLLVLCD